ncbi:MAG: hypothetical protein KKA55_13035 [Proteobacteria bacterium]|nr:hypothetical protein [Pseudomonadota bacterium]MBU1596443.1 hypothetical protein [Pseudomonadota bacterium]
MSIACSPNVENHERFVQAQRLKPGSLAISVDDDSAFDTGIMNGAARFTVDNAGQHVWPQEHGVYFQNGHPVESGLHSDLGEVCAGTKVGLRMVRRAAVLLGIALDDVMTGRPICQKALARNVSTFVQL